MKKLLTFLMLLTLVSVYASNDKYRLSLRGNPSTSIVIGWNQISGSGAKVYYGKTDYGRNYSQYPHSQSPDRMVDYKNMNNYFVRLTGLTPNTNYYFVIKDNDGTSQRLWFRTAPGDNSRISLISGGDSRTNRTPRRNGNLLVSKLKPNAIVFGGDMTTDGSSSRWQEWLDDWQYTIAADGRMFPIIAAMGNHESSTNNIYNLFDAPSDLVYYTINFGYNLASLITLNTEITMTGTQTEWFKNELEKSRGQIWKMVQYHKPMRPHVSHKAEGNTQYANWSGFIYDEGVKLVFESDAHTVKTTWPIRPYSGSGSDEGFVRDDENGTVYIGEGSWGAPLRDANDNKAWTRNSGKFNQFKWVFISEDEIEVRTVKIDNASEVGEVANSNVFQIPSNIDIWNPSNGAVITIPRNNNNNNQNELKVYIANSEDDVEEDKHGKIYFGSSDLEMVYDISNSLSYQKIGLRFQSLQIPKNVSIKKAYIQFTADETNNRTTQLKIAMEKSVNSSPFTDSYNVSDRPTFSTKIDWQPQPWSSGERGNAQRTPDLTALVQKLIDQDGWEKGNDASFSIIGYGASLESTLAKRVAKTYDSGALYAPQLVVEWDNNIDNGGGVPQDICSGIATWQDGKNYSEGDKVTYQGFLFEYRNKKWTQLGACGTIKSVNNSKLLVTPPLYSIKKGDIVVYPNPIEHEINVVLKQSKKGEKIYIQLLTMDGKLMLKKNTIATGIINEEVKLYPKNLKAGIYVLQVVGDNGKVCYHTNIVKE